jgi:hypothetical protein
MAVAPLVSAGRVSCRYMVSVTLVDTCPPGQGRAPRGDPASPSCIGLSHTLIMQLGPPPGTARLRPDVKITGRPRP